MPLLLPVFDCLQHTNNIIQREKAWEVLSHAMMSGRQKVATHTGNRYSNFVLTSPHAVSPTLSCIAAAL